MSEVQRKRQSPSKRHLRYRISYWIRCYSNAEERLQAHRKEIADLKRQIEWMQLKINHQYQTVEILGTQYRKAFREMFAEETKRMEAERRLRV